MSISATGPNAEMISYWSEQSGPKWVALQPVLDQQIEPLGATAMERSHIGASERVLDVGCGCGQTSLQLATRVGPEGSVLGIDVSTPMLDRARKRAAEAGLSQARFENADAQTFPFEPGSVDVVFSRFGVMFFADPVRAFTNLRRALRPGGRLAFVCWQGLERNPWVAVPLRAAARHVELPGPPRPGAPGPFAFADRERVQRILEAAGFSEVGWESHERELRVGGAASIDEAVDFLLQMGPLAGALRQAGEAAQGRLPDITRAVRAAVRAYAREDGGLIMPSASWIITALSR